MGGGGFAELNRKHLLSLCPPNTSGPAWGLRPHFWAGQLPGGHEKALCLGQAVSRPCWLCGLEPHHTQTRQPPCGRGAVQLPTPMPGPRAAAAAAAAPSAPACPLTPPRTHLETSVSPAVPSRPPCCISSDLLTARRVYFKLKWDQTTNAVLSLVLSHGTAALPPGRRSEVGSEARLPPASLPACWGEVLRAGPCSRLCRWPRWSTSGRSQS